jgi:hypothetical protein
MGQPEEIGKATVFLASQDASFVAGARCLSMAVQRRYKAQNQKPQRARRNTKEEAVKFALCASVPSVVNVPLREP